VFLIWFVVQYEEYIKHRKQVNKERSAVTETNCERDIVMILAKIKAKTVRERIRILDFLQVFDPNRQLVISKCNFVRALDQGRYQLSAAELETLMHVKVDTSHSGARWWTSDETAT
jgi:Ca2+-binding EF-hand superfamily protein